MRHPATSYIGAGLVPARAGDSRPSGVRADASLTVTLTRGEHLHMCAGAGVRLRAPGERGVARSGTTNLADAPLAPTHPVRPYPAHA